MQSNHMKKSFLLITLLFLTMSLAACSAIGNATNSSLIPVLIIIALFGSLISCEPAADPEDSSPTASPVTATFTPLPPEPSSTATLEVTPTITITPTSTPSPLTYYAVAKVGERYMISFTCPKAITELYSLAVWVNGVEYTDFEGGLYDPNHLERIYLIGSWKPNEIVQVFLTLNNESFWGEASIPLISASTPLPTLTPNPEENSDDDPGGAVVGQTVGETTA